jgi:AcrR family transcriptional regulator
METSLLSIRERQRQQRIEDILEAARLLTLEVGYETLTMDALAARAGMTKPTLYAHFENKEAIAVASVVRNIRRGRENLAQFPATFSPLTRLEKYYRWALVAKFVERHIAFGGAPVAVIRTNLEYRTAFQEMISDLMAIFEEGKRCGEISIELDTRTAIQAFVSVIRDTEYDDLIQKNIVTAEILVETLTVMLIRSLKSDTKNNNREKEDK